MNTERYKHIDFIKGFAIICIIFGHLGIRKIDRIVYTFNVPIFLFITGYLSNSKINFLPYLKKKIRKLILPYIITCFVVLLIACFNNSFILKEKSSTEVITEWINASLYGSGIDYTTPFPIKKIGAIWFLLASFSGQTLMYFIQKTKAFLKPFLVVGIFLAGYYSHKYLFQFPLSIQEGMCSTLYIYAGYLYKKTETKIDESSFKRIILIVSIIMWIRFMVFFTSFYLVGCDFGYGIIDIASSLCACYCLFEIAKLLKNTIEKSNLFIDFICYYGKISIIVLCVHLTEMNVFPYKYVLGNITGLKFDLMKLIVKLFIIFTCSIVIDKSNKMRKEKQSNE